MAFFATSVSCSFEAGALEVWPTKKMLLSSNATRVIVEALRPIVEPILDLPGDRVDRAVRAKIRAQAAQLFDRSELIAEHVAAGGLRIVGARYDLDDGRVTLVR